MLHYKYLLKLGVVGYAYNPFLQEAGAEDCHKFKASLGYIMRLVTKHQ